MFKGISTTISSSLASPLSGVAGGSSQPFGGNVNFGFSVEGTLGLGYNIGGDVEFGFSVESPELEISKQLAGDVNFSISVEGALSVVGAGGDYVNSVQAIDVNMAATTSNTATIAAVGSKAFILWSGMLADDANIDEGGMDVELTDSTTVTVTRSVSGAVASWGGYIVDANDSLVDKVERLTVTMTGTNITQNFSTTGTFDSTRTSVNVLGYKANLVDQQVGRLPAAYISGSGQITLEREAIGGGDMEVVVQLVEWNASALNQDVQHVAVSGTGTATTDDYTITAVDLSNTLLMYGGTNADNTDSRVNNMQGAELTSTTNLRMNRTSNNDSWKGRIDVVEFVDGVLASAQGVTESDLALLAGGTSSTETLGTTLNTAANATIAFTGMKAEASGTSSWRKLPKWSINNTTTAQADIGVARDEAGTVFYGQVVEWSITT